jgi:cleavage and polyadenylation specificity factor subunit 2
MSAFTPLLPPQRRLETTGEGQKKSLSLGQVHQSLLSFSPNIKMLIDVGWNADLSMDLDYLIRLAPSIDVILLTHATISHLGAYCYLSKIVPEVATIPVYATLPVISMGRMLTIDAYRSCGLLGPFTEVQLTIADVDAAFDRIQSLKYSQPLSLSGKLQGMTIAAYNAGHTLGGTIWRIQKDQEDIVYAVDWNHSRDSLLNGALLQQNGQIIESLNRPSVMICGSKISESLSLKKRKELLFGQVIQTLDRGGTVLIPTSSGARVLELCTLLDTYWTENKISAPLMYFSHIGARTMSYASSMLEWMSSAVITQWESGTGTPFETKHVKYVCELDQLTDGPKVILATGESLEAGFSRPLFAKLCTNDSTLVILTESTGKGTLSGDLFDLWNESGNDGITQLSTKRQLSYLSEIPLEGEELQQYNNAIEEKQRKEDLQNAIDARNRNILEQEESESSDDEEDELVMSGHVDLGVLAFGKDVYDYDVRGLKGRNRMFPYFPKRRRVDEYGEVIRPEDFMRITEKVERDDESADREESTKIGETRNWGTTQDSRDEQNRMQMLPSFAKPRKIVKVDEEIKVLCSVGFIDFEGLTDERSMKMIIPLIQPNKLIMIPENHDSPKLLDSLQQQMGTEVVVSAVANEPINASINSYAFNVKISPALESLLTWQKILGDFSVAHITGRLVLQPEQEEPLKLEGTREIKAEQNNEDDNNVLNELAIENDVIATTTTSSTRNVEIVPLQTAKELAAAPRSNPLLVGDIKLAELKKRLIAQGHKAEFRAEGILVCDDKVAVRKIAEGRLIIEGGLDKEFYQTKNVIRSLLASV